MPSRISSPLVAIAVCCAVVWCAVVRCYWTWLALLTSLVTS